MPWTGSGALISQVSITWLPMSHGRVRAMGVNHTETMWFRDGWVVPKRKWGVLLLYKNKQTTKRKIPMTTIQRTSLPYQTPCSLTSLHLSLQQCTFGWVWEIGFILQGCPQEELKVYLQGLLTSSTKTHSVNTVAWVLLGLKPQDLRSRHTIYSTGRGTWTVLPGEIYDIHEFTSSLRFFLLNGESIKPKLLDETCR